MSVLKETTIGADYFDKLEQFHKQEIDQPMVTTYFGTINHVLIKSFAAIVEANLIRDEEEPRIIKRVYHVVIESLQNISRHSDDLTTGEADPASRGAFLLSEGPDGYAICTGNVVRCDRVSKVDALLERVNGLDKDGLKAIYKEQIRSTSVSERGGAGLGFIDIAKKTGSGIKHMSVPINDKFCFIMFIYQVPR